VTFLTADALSHKFRRLGVAAAVERPALRRLRHGVATYLVGEGQRLKAQARLGHCDPTTTLRHYSHAVALHDEEIADALDEVLNGRPPTWQPSPQVTAPAGTERLEVAVVHPAARLPPRAIG
jgi:hypothetical protein